jgi:hypothetical protein
MSVSEPTSPRSVSELACEQALSWAGTRMRTLSDIGASMGMHTKTSPQTFCERAHMLLAAPSAYGREGDVGQHEPADFYLAGDFFGLEASSRHAPVASKCASSKHALFVGSR